MRKKTYILSLGVLCFSLLITTIAYARNSTEDIYFDAGNVTDGGDLRVTSSFFSACTPLIRSAILTTVSDILTDTVSTATLELTVSDVSVSNISVANPLVLSLFESTDFTEGDVALPMQGNPLNSSVTLTSPPAVGQTIAFPNSAEFAAFVNGATSASSGDGNVGVIVAITSCPFGNHTIEFEDQESGILGPNFTLTNPTAVELYSLEAQNNLDRNMVWIIVAMGFGLAGTLLFVRVRAGRKT
ncbi:MAG: hypothetical protein QNJ45_00385 [Ardenticatenaceae bacterium]|nr:hypothetical protein [Ardenticatenaceae bacterium]